MSTLAELLQRATVRTKGPWNDLTEPRQGIMLHYTAGTDLSGIEWLLFDPRCRVSYNDLVLDDGTCVIVAPPNRRAWHAGVCRRSQGVIPYLDANSAFYGVAIAAEPGDVATKVQLDRVVDICVGRFLQHGWPVSEIGQRLTDHAAEAWPRGRKHDTGAVLSLGLVRQRVAERLLGAHG